MPTVQFFKIRNSMSFEISGPSRAKEDNGKLELVWRGVIYALYFHHRN